MRVCIGVADGMTVTTVAAGIDTWIGFASNNLGCIGTYKEFHDISVQHTFMGFFPQNSESHLVRRGFLVGPVGRCQRIVNIANGHDAGLQWYVAGGKSVGVSGTVELL